MSYLCDMSDMHMFSDMSPQTDVFNAAIERFGSEVEEVRTAAAFAAGKSHLAMEACRRY